MAQHTGNTEAVAKDPGYFCRWLITKPFGV